MKKTLVLVFLFIANSVIGQDARDRGSVEPIFEDAIAAVGKKQDLARIKSISAWADCDGPKGKYTTRLISFGYDRIKFEQTFTFKPEPSNVFVNRALAWERNGDEYALGSPMLRFTTRMHDFQRLSFDFQRYFTEFRNAGEAVFEGNPSIKIGSKTEIGTPAELYFDKRSKRLSGLLIDLPENMGSVKVVFLKWDRVGPFTFPSTVRATDSKGDWTLRFVNIALDRADASIIAVPPRVADLAELMRLHEQQKTAHLSYNADLFIEMFADKLTQLQRGNATTRTRAENLKRFKDYFSSYKFLEWDDIVPPVFKISKDGTMATVIVQKRVRGNYKNEKGEEIPDHTVFAWLEVWEKIDGKWKVTTVASTEKSGQN